MSKVIEIEAPASKSVSHRMVIGAALGVGESRLANVLESDDLKRTMEIMQACGSRIERLGDGLYAISGVAGTPAGGRDEPVSCYVAESGTTCRLMTAIVAAGLGRFRIHGDPRMHERPIGELVMALRMLNVGVEWEGKTGYPPLVIDTDGMPGGEVNIGMDESSQYLSGLLMAGPLGKTLTINVTGKKVVSWPYVGLTLKAMEEFGHKFRVEMLEDGQWVEKNWRTIRNVVPGKTRFVVKPGFYHAGDYRVEGDWSNASYFLGAGAVGPNPVRITGLRADSLQGDKAMLKILQDMGARVEIEPDAVTVHPSRLKGITVDMGDCPDIVPTVAAIAAYAEGPTTVTNVGHLRIKECDRLAGPAAQLAKAGIKVDVHEDGLTVHPAGRESIKAPAGTVFEAYNDHRMAMSLSLLCFAGVQVELDDPKCVAKSFPGFWRKWAKVSA
jgi:3-phosphoshikimate 1-carboxyvinyltransferase